MKTTDKKLTLSKTTVKNLNARVRTAIRAGFGTAPLTIAPKASCQLCGPATR